MQIGTPERPDLHMITAASEHESHRQRLAGPAGDRAGQGEFDALSARVDSGPQLLTAGLNHNLPWR